MQDPKKDLPYDRLGGADGVRRLVDRFYAHMDQLPQAAAIRALHPEQLTRSRQKFFEFLCGWLGGPKLYVERHGHPRMRLRHMPFAIGNRERDAWMACMNRALDECVSETMLRMQLRSAFRRMADHIRNAGDFRRPEDDAPA